MMGRGRAGGLSAQQQQQQVLAVPCEADKRRTDTSDTPVSESVDGAWSGHASGGTRPPEKMIREMAETGGEPAEVSREL